VPAAGSGALQVPENTTGWLLWSQPVNAHQNGSSVVVSPSWRLSPMSGDGFEKLMATVAPTLALTDAPPPGVAVRVGVGPPGVAVGTAGVLVGFTCPPATNVASCVTA
jgi:hypothetical protein